MCFFHLLSSLFYPVLSHPVWIASVLVVSISATAPAFSAFGMLSFVEQPIEYYTDLYYQRKALLEGGGYRGASEEESNLFEASDLALKKIVQADNKQERYLALSEYAEAELALYDHGNLSGAERYSYEAESLLYRELSQLDDPVPYCSSDEMPALNYLSFVFAQNSPLFWLLPIVVSGFLVLLLSERKKLVGCAPYSSASLALASWIAAVLLSVSMVALAMLPGFLLTLVRNGLGDVAYPVVFTQSEKVLHYSLGVTLLKQIELLLLAASFITIVEIALSRLTGSETLGAVAAAAMCLMPTISGYMDSAAMEAEAQTVLAYLPTTYLSFGPIAGFPGAYQAVEILSIPGASFERGVLVLTLSTVFIAALGAGAFAIVRGVKRMRRGYA